MWRSNLVHDGNTLSVDGTQIGVFKERYKVGFGSFLEGQNCSRLETKVVFEALRNFTNEALERQLTNEEVSGLLVPSDLTKCNSSWAVTVGLLDTVSIRRRLASSLGCQLLTRGLSSGRLTSALLCSRHFWLVYVYLSFTTKQD